MTNWFIEKLYYLIKKIDDEKCRLPLFAEDGIIILLLNQNPQLKVTSFQPAAVYQSMVLKNSFHSFHTS